MADKTFKIVEDKHGCSIHLDGEAVAVIDYADGVLKCYKLNRFGETIDDGYCLNDAKSDNFSQH